MSTFLDVMIGLVFVYVFFSMITFGITEWIAQLGKLGAKVLKGAVEQLVGSGSSGSLAAKLYGHSMIAGLADSRVGPTYIPSAHFALALMYLAVDFPAPPTTGLPAPHATARGTVGAAGPPLTTPEKELIESVIQDLNSAGAVQARIEQWFEDSMERVSGRYKHKTYWMLLVISLIVSIALGVDTIRLSREFYRNSSLRAAVLKQAETAIEKSPDPSKADIALKGLDLPLGFPSSFKFCHPSPMHDRENEHRSRPPSQIKEVCRLAVYASNCFRVNFFFTSTVTTAPSATR